MESLDIQTQIQSFLKIDLFHDPVFHLNDFCRLTRLGDKISPDMLTLFLNDLRQIRVEKWIQRTVDRDDQKTCWQVDVFWYVYS